MDGEKDVLGKADALLRRHAGGGSDTSGVPVLTDIVDTQDAEAAELVRQITARVMTTLEEQFAPDLETRLVEQLSVQVQAAVMVALDDLKEDLARTIGAAVAEALKRAKP